MKLQSITPVELHQLRSAGHGVDIIDVRRAAEFAEVHAEGAVNVPLDKITPQSVRSVCAAADKPVYIICKSGGRSAMACQQLISAGMTDVVNVEGGTMAWERAGLPVVRSGGGAKRNALRAVALVLVVVLLVLGFMIHPAFGIAAAGLWFAMVLVGGCPLGSCSVPPPAQKSGGCCQ